MKTLYTTTLAGYEITLKQNESSKAFKVAYGKEIHTTKSYKFAAAFLGEAIMHALACEGLLDNETI
jgi:hypothetical protein